MAGSQHESLLEFVKRRPAIGVPVVLVAWIFALVGAWAKVGTWWGYVLVVAFVPTFIGVDYVVPKRKRAKVADNGRSVV